MVAALAVVILHIPLPEPVQSVVFCLCQFANPIFFAITGYFNYQATGSQLRRRFVHIMKLYLTAHLFHLVWNCIATELDGGSTIAYLRAAIPDPNEIIWWLAFQQDSFLAQLWFLASTALSYLVLWGYTAFAQEKPVNYRPLYQLGAALYLAYFILAIIMPIAGISVSFYVYRNGWLLGLPMFFLGMFLHEHQQRIFRCFHLSSAKLLLIVFAGCALDVFQLYSGTLHGTPIAVPVITAALLLFLAANPGIPGLGSRGQAIVSKFGTYSTGIYLFHITVSSMYHRFLVTPLSGNWPVAEAWLRPFLIYGISLLFAIIWERLGAGLGRAKKRRS